MRKIMESLPRHGSERTHQVLTGPNAFGGWMVNFKRAHRIWKEEHMQVPRKQRKCRRLPGSIITLQCLFAVHGAPEHLRSDNGPEFVAKELQELLARACVRTLYIQKASPWENGYVESFHGRLRDKLLDGSCS